MRSRKRRAFRHSHTGLTRRSRIGRVLLSVAIALPTLVLSLAVGTQTANAAGSGLNFYWKNESGSTTDITRNEFTTGTCATAVSNINYAWNTGSPSGCNTDGFTSFATGYISAFNSSDQTMYFCDQSDDGFYLQINGTEIISNWAEQGASTGCNATGSFTFSANTVYTIKVWHHENSGGADMRLLWSTTQGSYSIVPAANLATSASLLKPSFDSMASYLPNYDYGNNTYNYGPAISSNSCGINQNTACSYTVSGGTTSYTYSISAGSLPSVLTLNTSTGSLFYNSSGTFAGGTFSGIKIKVTDANGMWAESTPFSINFNKRPISVTPYNYTKVYGASVPSYSGYTFTGNLQYTDTFTATETSSVTTTTSVGNSSIYVSLSFGTLNSQCSSTPSNCYDITLNTGIQYVTAKPITIKANAVSKQYGYANPSLTGYSITTGGVVATDTFTVTETTTATQTSNIGTYPIYPTLSFTTGSASNYSVTLATDNLTITTRPINVKANNANKNFGSADPSPLTTYTLTGSMAGGDTITVTFSRATGEGTTSTYTITPAVSTSTPSNYTLTTDTGTFTINPSGTVTLTVASPANVTYSGSAVNVTKSYAVTGLALGDSITAVAWRYNGTQNDGTPISNDSNAPSHAGNYTLTTASETFTVTGGSANYTSFAKNPGSFTVLRKVPNLTLSYTSTEGLALNTTYFNRENYLTIAYSLDGSPIANKSFTSTTPTVCSVNGTATITTLLAGTCTVIFASSQSADYDTASVAVSISVLLAPRTITSAVGSVTRKYGQTTTVTATPSLGASDGTKSFYTSTSTKCSVDLTSGLVTIISPSGTCSVYSKISTGTQYDSATSATLSITLSPADTLTINANNLSAVTYSPSKSPVNPTYTATGLVNGDTLTISSSNGYIYKSYTSQTCAQGGNCKLGDVGPGGGIVFYADYTFNMDTSTFSTGGHYLEAAPAAASTSSSWCTWSGVPDSKTVSTVGYGAANTVAMISYCSLYSGSSPAADAARNYRGPNSFTDWFVPSSSELSSMISGPYQSAIGITSGSYWSSTRSSIEISQSCSINAATKTTICNQSYPSLLRVWAIRAFSNTIGLNPPYGPTTTKPTSAGTYSITVDSTTATFTSGSLSNYVNATYDYGLVTINKATSAYLRINQSSGNLFWAYGQTLSMFAVSDNNDTTTATFNIANGAYTTCYLTETTTSSSKLSATATWPAAATCYVSLSRNATDNYNALIGDTVTVTFYRFIGIDPTPTVTGGGNIAVGIGTPQITIDPDSTPLPSQSSYTAAALSSLTISGSGFTGVNRVRFAGGGGSVSITGATDSGFTFTVPALAATGPLVIYKVLSNGSVSPIFVDFVLG